MMMLLKFYPTTRGTGVKKKTQAAKAWRLDE